MNTNKNKRQSVRRIILFQRFILQITSKERHELTHMKDRVTQWSCTLCSKNFSDESSLVYHVKNKVCIKRGIAKV